MNQWTWLFKKSRFSKSPFKTRVIFGGTAGILVILGCQNLMRPASSSNVAGAGASSASAPAVIEDKSPLVASIKVFITDVNGKEAYAGEFDRSSCVAGMPTLWSANFDSVFGTHRFDIDFTSLVDNKSKAINVRAGKERFQVQAETAPEALKKQGLCDLPFRTEKTSLPAGGEAAKELMSLVQTVAPDCNFAAGEGNRLSCTIAHGGEGDIRSRLDQLTKNMSTKWNHQPYLLIRRMTLTRQLLDASQIRDEFKSVQKFCRVIAYSLPHELPLAFRSQSWQNKVCREKTPDQDLIFIGLDQSVKEIESLAHRIEDSSLVGTFTLAVPHDKSPVKEYWITLQPMDQPLVVKIDDKGLNPCVWHPIFADQVDKALIAMDLGQLKSPTGKSFCAPVPDLAKAMKDSDHYIRASIASEMEFPIVNGQSKLLRLPTGDYKFSITQLNGPFSEEMFTTEEIIPISIGQVSWKTNRPHLVIKSW